ncbi:hypothetical protein [Protaetiibacter intestinalis]|uniref:Tetratricopeptide repeat protein n=1 Tax=Protaetiibacter intestinalis TaxID=2419774 RepID=A0A387B5W9_9MICO|nr:hypothetical protein [Protaetiibacter intestinalis]AYF97148.1 hypothetical protein D7I47_02065 [Protaetiibacter intestinalis]
MTDPLLRANRRRRLARRIALIASAPLVIVALLVCGKLLSMYAFANQAISSYAAGDYPGTVSAARGQEPFNYFEPYKAPFNRGVGLADAGELDAARLAFEEALALATGMEECPVRVNLSIVWERIGDAAEQRGDAVTATQAWQEALIVVQEAPADCQSEELSDQREDLSDKLRGRDDEEEPAPTPDQDQLDELQDQLDQGAEDRDDQNEGGDGDEWTDRPW